MAELGIDLDNKDAGDQAVQQCSDGSWCCDHNRDPANYCCDTSNKGDFFQLPQGSAYASIDQLATGGSAATEELTNPTVRVGAARPESSSSSTTTTTTHLPSPPGPPNRNPETLVVTSEIVHDPARPGKTSVVLVTSIVAPTLGADTTDTISPPDSQTQDEGSSPNVAAIAGGVGGGVAVVAGAALGIFFCLHRRKKRRRREEREQVLPTEYLADRKSIEYMYKGNEEVGTPLEEGGSPEIDGREVGGASGVYRGVQPTNKGLGVYAAERLGEGEPSPLTTPSLKHQSHKTEMEMQRDGEISELP